MADDATSQDNAAAPKRTDSEAPVSVVAGLRRRQAMTALAVLGIVTGNAQWLGLAPEDPTTRASYTVTSSAIEKLGANLQASYDRLEARQRDYEDYANRRIRFLERKLHAEPEPPPPFPSAAPPSAPSPSPSSAPASPPAEASEAPMEPPVLPKFDDL